MPIASVTSQPYIPLRDWQDESYETNARDVLKPRHDSKNGTEKGFIILRHFRSRFVTALLVHGPAIALSSIVIYLTAYPRFWVEDEWYNKAGQRLMSANDLSKVFQFVAKIHEIFVVVSLSAMMLSILRHRLIDNSDGVALGLLTAPYRVGDIKFLFSGAFWQSAGTRSAWAVTVLSALCTLVSLLIGPASAIGFVPTQNWWAMPNPFGNWLMPMPVHWTDRNFIGPNSIEHVWPTILNSSLVDEGCNTTEYLGIGSNCPSGGFFDIGIRLTSSSISGAPTDTGMKDIVAGAQRQLVSKTYACGSARCSISTTLSHVTLLGFGTFWDYARLNNGGRASDARRPRLKSSESSVMMQPLVQVACTSLDYYEARDMTSELKHPFFMPSALGWFDGKDSSRSGNVTVPSYLWNVSQPENNLAFQWIDTANLSFAEDRRPTIATIATIPYNVTATLSRFVVSCAVDARWMYSQAVYDPESSDLVYSNVSIPANYEVNPGVRSNLEGIGPHINISSDWMKYIDILNTTTNTSYTTQILYDMVSFMGMRWANTSDLPDRDSIRQAITGNISTMISMLLVDGIARTHYGYYMPVVSLKQHDGNTSQIETQDVFFVDSENNTHIVDENALNKLLPMELVVEQFGWGTGSTGSATTFAFVMMVIYLSFVVGFICYASFDHIVRRPYSVNSWGTLEELVVLALKSMPPRSKLDKAGAAVKWTSTIWKEKVKVKADVQRSVEMLIEDREGMCTLSRDVEYH
jgi:hypothetical protein